MMPLRPLPLLVPISLLVSGACGYSSSFGKQHQQRSAWSPRSSTSSSSPSRHHPQHQQTSPIHHHRPLTTAAAATFSNTRSASRSKKSSSSALHAGLRDLVGPYDDGYVGGGGPYIPPSIRDERNSVFLDDNGSFGSGGYGSGGNSGLGGGRSSPGFVGFDNDRSYRNRGGGGGGDRNYPRYDVDIGAPPPPRRGGRGRVGGGGGGGRFYDDIPPPPPGSATRRISDNYGPYANGYRADPYDRGFDNDDFINGGGSGRRRTPRSRSRTIDILPRGDRYLPEEGIVGGGGGGGRALPQIYRRDYLDTLDGRSFGQLNPAERFFEAWNLRNIPLALSCFDDDVYYDDTQFSEPFDGKEKLADHLLYVSDCLPESFYFVVDEVSVGGTSAPNRRRFNNFGSSNPFQFGNRGDLRTSRRFEDPTVNIGALWHVENEFGPLPFARGCSFFKVDPVTNLIVEVYDFAEPAVIKTGSIGLKILSVASKVTREPERWFPFFAWIAYVYIVYFSNGILPGKDIFHADTKTWDEVRSLTYNFMFIAPATHMPTAAKLNPVLEGIFNGLLAWAFMFAGFLSDERGGMGPYGRDARYYERMILNREQVLENGIVLVPPVSITKKNLLRLVPTIVWMQFFMSAFLLPYLFSRTAEKYSSEDYELFNDDDYRGPRRIRPLYKEELDRPALVLGEWKGLGILLGSIGIFALYWGFAGRPGDFGPPIWVSDKRMVDFMKLLDKDRVASAFVVDLWIFGIFQGWLVDDDWKRRGRSLEEEKFLRNCAKFIPFFGLAAYLIWRPSYPSSKEGFDYEGFFLDRRDARERGGRGRDDFGFGGDRFRDRY
mmetsp:Transcript_39810/g.83690  ORF Transcript_39810/g.83690 Transcript_39810/m.83690 type:complete len:829 (-) Transcript_39810:288-2774(-)|eukprot:CAMPEP_0183730842 /NCGR_PEP_ID=MMETSP0737-20130205/33738_1 /TAXON_ID=385413 /ORGANISM="Thalassiosira miniscula, Strain CCMP1093" /LENGTH=828 /DNA_ID=CAMNT_0025963425 /DNA_START=88 /DNA_END=2574 /DNA_ORIENTATION=+